MAYNKITISGYIATGKSSLFNTLKKTLGWKSFSVNQYFRNRARRIKASIQTASEQNDNITKKVDFRVRNMLQQDTSIIVEGWMAGLMAENIPDVLKIFLTCDETVRTVRYTKREEVSIAEARKQIQERETNLAKKLSEIYKRDDFFDLAKYNLVIDTSKLTKKQIVKKVLERLQVDK